MICKVKGRFVLLKETRHSLKIRHQGFEKKNDSSPQLSVRRIIKKYFCHKVIIKTHIINVH